LLGRENLNDQSPEPGFYSAWTSRIDHSDWDQDRCLREFIAALLDKDSDVMMATMLAMDRVGCWHEAFYSLLGETSPVEASSVIWLWTTYGFHVASSLKGDRILVDVLKALLPPYAGPSCILYRGELESLHVARQYGIAWTPKLKVAEMFASRRDSPQERLGIVLKINASPEMILAAPCEHSKYLGESEYLIDPRLIRSVDTVP
jgi:hypothetical protein